jgi:hypothetical protein
VKDDGFGKFSHRREVMAVDQQFVERGNRDTLYSIAVFDLDAGPVTITMPNAGKRFMSLQIIDEDQALKWIRILSWALHSEQLWKRSRTAN